MYSDVHFFGGQSKYVTVIRFTIFLNFMTSDIKLSVVRAIVLLLRLFLNITTEI